MTFSRFPRYLIAGVLSAALLAGCSSGSQFTPGAASQQPAAVQPAAAHVAGPHRDFGIGQTVVFAITWWRFICFYDFNVGTGQLKLLFCIPNRFYGIGGWGWGKEYALSASDGDLDVYLNKKLLYTMSGMNGPTTGVTMDSKGDTFATNPGTSQVVEFPPGGTEPIATYADPNLSSAAYLGIDKSGHVYVEGQAASSGGIEVDEMVGSGSFEALAPPGTLGVTAGGLGLQTSGKTTYVWINDQGNASVPASIARYALTAGGLTKQGSFTYSGIDGAIAVDPKGKDTTDVYATNNAAEGSEYSVTGVVYSFPTGKIEAQTPAQTQGGISSGIMVR